MMARMGLALTVLAAMAPVLCGAQEPNDFSWQNSLLFYEGDAHALSQAIRDFDRMRVTGAVVEEKQAEAPPDVPNIFVSALAYYGEGDWTVWANGYRVTPTRQPPQFSVIAVNADKAEIAVGGSKPARFFLRPSQTWRSRTNDVVEGIVP